MIVLKLSRRAVAIGLFTQSIKALLLSLFYQWEDETKLQLIRKQVTEKIVDDLAGKGAHQSFNGQQGCCVVAQVGAGIHDGVDLFDGGLWLGLFSQSTDLSFKLFVDECVIGTGLNHHDITVESCDIKQCCI